MPNSPAAEPTPSELLIDAINAKPRGRLSRRSIGVNMTHDLYDLVSSAADARGMSATAYMRRAAVAFAVFDGDLDWDEVMAHEPGTSLGGKISLTAQPAGRGFGAWLIEGLK